MRNWRTFPYWLFSFLVLTAAIAVWRHDVLTSRPYWGAAMGVFAQAEAIGDPSLAKAVERSSPAPAMYRTSVVPHVIAWLRSILPNPTAVLVVVRVFNYACASLCIVLIVWWLRRRIGWGSAAITAAAILTTPLFLVQVEQVGLEMTLIVLLVAASILLFEGHPLLATLAGTVAFFVKWTAAMWFAAAIVSLLVDLVRRSPRGRMTPIVGLVANGLALALAGVILYVRSVPEIAWGGWIADERYGTSPIQEIWRWCPDVLVLAGVSFILWAIRSQQPVQAASQVAAVRDSSGEAVGVTALDPPFPLAGALAVILIGTAAVTGATPATFVVLVPFLWMAAGILLLSSRRWNLWGMVVCFLAVGFNLYNSDGKLLPAIAAKPGADCRTGSLLERSREYYLDYVETDAAIRALIRSLSDSKTILVAAPMPFVEYLTMPGLGYELPKALHGYSLSSFTTERFPSIERLKTAEPGDLAVVHVWNRYTVNNAWADPRPRRGDANIYFSGDRKVGGHASPLIVYVARRLPSDSDDVARQKYARRFWPESSMIAAAREYLQNDDPVRAEMTLRAHLESSPNSSTGRYMLGQILEQRGDAAGAVAEYSKVAVGSAEYWQATLKRAAIEAAAGRLDQADGLFEECIQSYDKQNSRDTAVLGSLYLSWAEVDIARQAWDSAEAKLRSSLEADPRSSDAYRELGWVLLHKNRRQDAVGELERALELNRQDGMAYRYLGIAHAEMDQWSQARDSFRQALALQPGDLELQDFLATALLRLGQHEEAIAEYEDALARSLEGPIRAPLYFGLAKAQKAAGKPRDSVSSLESALSADANYKDAANELAWTLSTSPEDGLRDGARAVTLAEKLIEGPGASNAAYLDTLACAYAEVGQFENAVETARKAMDLAKSQGDVKLEAEIAARLSQFREGKPYRESADSPAPPDSAIEGRPGSAPK